jgi:hypothetical protein
MRQYGKIKQSQDSVVDEYLIKELGRTAFVIARTGIPEELITGVLKESVPVIPREDIKGGKSDDGETPNETKV